MSMTLLSHYDAIYAHPLLHNRRHKKRIGKIISLEPRVPSFTLAQLNPAPSLHIPVGLNFLFPNFERKI